MSVAPKSLVSAQKRRLRSSVVTSITSQKRAFGNKTQGLSISVAKEPVVLKKGQRSKQRQQITQIFPDTYSPQIVERGGTATPKIWPQSESIPTWLRALMGLQRYSSVATFILVSGVLVVYGSTVYTQKLWSHEYRKLETYQRQERQLTAAGEVLKNQLANQAENPDTGLVSPSPDNNLFLESSPLRPMPETKTLPKPAPNPKLTPTPIGY